MNLDENIYRYRTQKNMSQGDLADALDVSRQSVSKWETGSAVPELEKLVKMSRLFDVSLDELVGEARPASRSVSPTPAGVLTGVPSRMIAGTVILACAFLTFLVITVADSASAGLLWTIPFLPCGITCFVFKRHVGVWCAWALYLPLSFIPMDQFMRPDLSFLTRLFVQVPILIYTVVSFRREKLELTTRVKWFLGVGYIVWFLFFSMLLATASAPSELYDGFNVGYVLEVLAFPLFSALLTTSLRVLKEQ